MTTPHIVIAGGGYVGMYTALGPAEGAAQGRGAGSPWSTRGRHDLPAVPARGGGRQPGARHVVVPLRKVLKRCEVLTARVVSIDHAHRDACASSRVEGRRTTWPTTTSCVALGSIARTLPIPGLAERGDGLQADRGGDRAAQPGAGPAGHRGLRPRRGDPAPARSPSSSSAAGTPGSRRWPRSRTWRASRRKYYDNDQRRRTCASCWSRGQPDPARGRRGPRASTRSTSCASAASRSGSAPGWSPASTGTSCSPTGREFDADTIVWTAGVKANPVLALERPAARRAPAASWRAPTCGSTGSRTPGPPATTPPCRTSPSPASSAPRTPSTPSARPGCWPRTSSARCAASRSQDYRHKYVGSVASLGLLQGRRAGLRHQGAGLPGLVHAPDLPPEPGADLQPQGPGRSRLDAGALLPARGRLARHPARPARGLRPRERLVRLTAGLPRSPLASGIAVLAPPYPNGRGSALKRRPVWVRVPPGAHCDLSRHRRQPNPRVRLFVICGWVLWVLRWVGSRCLGRE